MIDSRVIENDMYNISGRIKEIDEGYFIVFSYRYRRYEVHNLRQPKTLAIVVPYDELDCRTERLVQRTRVERKKQLIEEMERNNRKLEEEEFYNKSKLAEKAMEDALNKK